MRMVERQKPGGNRDGDFNFTQQKALKISEEETRAIVLCIRKIILIAAWKMVWTKTGLEARK